MKDLVLIKLGGSVITDKSKLFTARVETIKRLVKEIKKKYINKETHLIIGHGQGSFAHIPAAKYQTQKGIVNSNSVFGFAEVSEMAKRPNTILTQEFLKAKIPAVSFSPMSFIYTNKMKVKKILISHIYRAMNLGLIPVVYGDVILDDSKQGFGIYSGETTLDILASKFVKNYRSAKVIYYTDTFGVLDGRGRTIAKITPKNFGKIKKYLKGSGNTDVTGGMVHKVEESLKMVIKLDIEIYIVNGLEQGSYTKICNN